MKIYIRLILWWLVLGITLAAHGQTITRVEYFLDYDPGFGNATAVPITVSASLTNTFSVPLATTLPNGFHFLGVRAQDANGRWSPVTMRPFLKEQLPPGITTAAIAAIEYFVDADPGFGAGTPVAFAPGTAVNNAGFTIPLPGSLATGFHFVSIRVKDTGGRWSTVTVRPFVKESLAISTLANLNRIEYFIDTDPGFGNGTAIPFTAPATNLNNLAFSADLTGISQGTRRLFVRARNDNNQWATLGVRTFAVCTNPVSATIQASTTQPVCQGNSVELSVATGFGYQWQRNNSNIGGATGNTYSATQSGDYSVLITSGVCSITTTPVAVQVTPTPPAPVIVTPSQTVCSSQTLVLEASGCPGSTVWSNGSTGAGILVNPGVTTTYSATCLVNGCSSSGGSAITLTVVPGTSSPAISAANNTICEGTATTLTATNCAGTVRWNTGQTGITLTVSPVVSTTYSAVCQVGNCPSLPGNVLTLTVTPTTANRLVINSPNQAICPGFGGVSLPSSGCNGSVLWSNGNNGASIFVTPTVTTVYSATCTDNGCSGSSLNSVQVTANARPATPTLLVPSAQTLCNGTPVTLDAFAPYATIYWDGTYPGNLSYGRSVNPVVVTAESPSRNSYGAFAVSPEGCGSMGTYVQITGDACDNPNVSVNRIEYFIDNDPGFGNATAPVTTPVSSWRFDVPLPIGLSNGFHWLTVRVRDQSNRWSVATVRPFLKESLPGSISLAALNRIEYFVDADPGFGLGISVGPISGTVVSDLNFAVPLSGSLATGFHFLTVRARDVSNKWSEVTVRPFFNETLPTSTSANIVAMEYFVDNDPGFGSGSAITGFTPGSAVSRNITIGLGNVATGAHKLTIRAKDANGNWGIVGIRDFFVQDNLMITSGIPASSCRETAFNIQFTASGNYTAGNVFTALLSNASGSFVNPTTLGSVSGTASGVISATVPGAVAVGSGYQIRVVSSAPAITNSPFVAMDITALCQCLLNASLMSGNWSTPGIWSCGRVPIVTDPVRISAGHTVAVDVNNATAKSLSLWGGLQYQAGSKLRIEP